MRMLVESSFLTDTISLYARTDTHWVCAGQHVMHTPGTHPPAFTLLSATEAQELMDGLWRCGVRPTEGKGSAGQLSATERHLQDMRALVFKTGAPK